MMEDTTQKRVPFWETMNNPITGYPIKSIKTDTMLAKSREKSHIEVYSTKN